MRKRQAKPIERVVIYTRVSTTEQAEQGVSLDAQRTTLRRYAAERGYVVVREYEERGASGTDDNRPVFKQMMGELVRKGSDVDAVLVLHTSRFMRSVEKARVAKGVLRRHGIRVVAAQQPVEDDPAGRLMETLLEGMDQYESEIIGERTSIGMSENARQGFFNGSSPPYGFCVEKVRAGERVKGRLVQAPAEAAIVREVFRLYAEGKGALSVARVLNQRGMPYRKGKPWSKDLVLKVLDEEAAIGTYYWGKRSSKRSVVNDRESWIPIPVEPIVPVELFDAARELRQRLDPSANPGRTASSPLLLAGLVVCGRCGASMQLETGKGGAYRYYNCRSATRAGREACPGYRVRTEDLEGAVLEHMANELFSRERCRALLADLVEEGGVLRAQAAERRKSLLKQKADVEKRIERWVEAFESGVDVATLGADRLRELKERKATLEAELEKLGAVRPPPPNLYSDATIARFQSAMREIFESGDATVTKGYLRALVEKIVVYPDQVDIYGKRAATLRFFADPPKAEPEGFHPPVPTTDLGWLRRRDSNPRPGG